MSPEILNAIYTALAFGLGWTCHIGWKMLVAWHDSEKDRRIELQMREIARLRAQLDAHGGIPGEEAPMPMTDAEPAPMPLEEPAQPIAPAAPAPRKRRSPAKAKITPLQPVRFDTMKVPQGIGQADLGRMQAQLASFGRCRTVFTGGIKP